MRNNSRSPIILNALQAGYLISENGLTIREAAVVIGKSKSTIHKYIHERLKYVDNGLYARTIKVLSSHFEEKHLRGGIATKMKFKAVS
jgi:putative DeoR family transcriptional regulator (stage III sporulation protein D)